MSRCYKSLTLILIFILIFSTGVSAVNLKDVPKNHWAYKSVKELVEEGYLTLYEDGTFSGEKKVSRYELAVLVARILDNISQGKKEADIQDVETLRKLSLEFRDELVEIAKQQEIFKGSLIEVQKKVNIIQNEDISQIHERINGLDNKISAINGVNSKISANEKEIEKIIDNIIKIKNLEEEVTKLKTQVNSLATDLNETNLKVKEREKTIAELKNNMDKNLNQKIEDQHAITLTRIKSLENRINELESQLASTNEKEDSKDKKQLDNSTLYLGAAAVIILLAGMN